ncbi:MAG: hydrogenase formation protein HypD [Planctomycetes bacterium]|nr:hydrogenase formation protein HypD [Planctomycetota bacterium]
MNTDEIVKEIGSIAATMNEIRFMEVCGTHTVALFRSGVRSLLPSNLKLLSGPGCPVCVTSQGYIDAALEVAKRPGVTVCTYGDMLRVPGRQGSLEAHRAHGVKVVVCYSIRDSIVYAESHPDEEVVFLSVGFETTSPAAALGVLEATWKGLENFSILSGHKCVMPALEALLGAGEVPIHGFLLPGHVSVIIGSGPYQSLVDKYKKACVIAGFEPEQLLLGIRNLARQLSRKTPCLENIYKVAVRPEGNPQALETMDRVFEPADTVWRALGTIPNSGLELREEFHKFDARLRYDLTIGADYDPPGCRCGEVIQGKVPPGECALFGKTCTYEDPVGPCMVSSEGSCAAWYRYGGILARKAVREEDR